jgi:chromate reductase
MAAYTVGYLVGSISSGSINRILANALIRVAPPELRLVEIEISELPLYRRDYDVSYPPEGLALKTALDATDAVLFVTPEYNRSIPGALKNAIDWASRPWGRNSLARKPSGVIGASTGKIGTAVAQQHLKSILSFCNSPMFNSVEAYIQFDPEAFSPEGEVLNASTEAFLHAYMVGFRDFVERVLTVLPREVEA